ncbi:MAG: putative thioesterase [Bacteroidota bacterium]|nr:putative thioesterase [Bacteroidota bacterium]
MSHKEVEQNIKYPFPVKQEILWGEMDGFNHINNVIYFRYFETGRVHFMYESGIWQMLLDEGVYIVVGKLDCNFIQPLIYPNEIEISVGIKAVGNTSFTVHQKVTSLSKGLCAHGDAIIVGTDPETGLKKPWNDKLRAEFSKWM